MSPPPAFSHSITVDAPNRGDGEYYGGGTASADGGKNAGATVQNVNLEALAVWLQTFHQVSDLVGDGCDSEGIISDFGNAELVDTLLDVAQAMCDDNFSQVKNEDGSCATILDKWVRIATLVECEESNVERILSNSTEDPVSACVVEPILASMLSKAVSAECPLQKTYIGRIMQLDSSVQMVLMKIISENSGKENDAQTVASHSVVGDGTVANSICSPAGQSKASLTATRGRNEGCPHSSTGYTPLRKKERAYEGENSTRGPLSAVKMYTSVGDQIFSPVGSVLSPLGTEIEEQMRNNRAQKNSETDKEELMEKLTFVSSELEVACKNEAALGAKLQDIEAKHRAEKMKIEADSILRENELRNQNLTDVSALKKEVEDLRSCRQSARDAKEELDSLRDEIDIYTHTKDKLATTEDQLRRCKEKLEEIGDVKEALTRTEAAHSLSVARSLELENEVRSLQPLRRQLEDYKARAIDAEVGFAESQEELRRLRNLSSELTGTNKELKQGVLIHQSETEGLRKRLVEESDKSATNGPTVGEGLSELNPELMAEMERLRNQNSRLEAFAAQREDDAVQQMEEALDDQQRLANRYKEQFLATKNELQDTRQELRDSCLREGELKLVVANLKNDVSRLEKEISDEKLACHQAQLEAERLLQETKQNLVDKAKEDMDSLQETWRELIENEKKIYSDKLEKEVKEKQCIVESSSRELAETREKAASDLTSAKNEADLKIKGLIEEKAQELCQLKKDFEVERDSLVAKGKRMIKDIKSKSQQDLNTKDEMHAVEKGEIKQIIVKFTENQKEFEEKARAKVLQYKNKLLVSEKREIELSQESEDLHRKTKKLEREKLTLQGENDRFRRQLGCHFGVDSGFQKQFETLQREFNDLLEENKSLKKKMLGGGVSSFDFHSNVERSSQTATRSYNAANKDSSTISQLRAEYEDTLQKLQDEKRELIMKNSAAMSDAQKADQRSWELEEELGKVKNQFISAKLSLQRMERQNTGTIDNSFSAANTSQIMSPDQANTSHLSIQSYHTTISGTPDGSKHIQAEFTGTTEGKENQNNNERDNIFAGDQSKKPRSLVDYTKMGQEGNEGGQQECQQS